MDINPLWAIKPDDIVSIDTQYSSKWERDIASVRFKVNGTERFAWIKDLSSKPADMDIKDFAVLVLNTHYLVKKKEEEKRANQRIIVPA